MSSRVAPVEPPYSAAMQADFDIAMRGLPPLRLFRTVARNPRVLSRMMAGGLLDRGSISLRQRELMILRTTALCGAEYEWGVHVAAFTAKAGWSADQIRASVHGGFAAGCWSGDEVLILRLAEALHRQQDVGDDLWNDLRSVFDEAQLIELIMLAGLYHTVSFVAKATRVELESFAPRFPAL